MLILPMDASEGGAVRFPLTIAIPGLQRSRGCGTGTLFAQRARPGNAHAHSPGDLAQGFRSLAGHSPRIAEVRVAWLDRQPAASSLAGPSPVRIYRPAPL